MNLNDDDIALLDARANGTAAELTAFLDDVTEASEREGRHDSSHSGVLAYHPVLFRKHLDSHDIEKLTTALTKGEVMDRVLACLRLLCIPESQIPPDTPKKVMQVAQHHLSQLLVDHPVLMHNRIFVKGMHFVDSEFGPIATIIGLTPRAEFPRLEHGVKLEQLRAFARHHCVLTGLTKAAPASSKIKGARMQGRTLLGAFSPNLRAPHPRLLTSLMELDDYRAASFTASRRPASFLACRGKPQQLLRTCVAGAMLAAVNISTLYVGTNGLSAYDSMSFMKVLKTSGIVDESWFLASLESNLYRWVLLPVEQVESAFFGLGQSLLELKPIGLASDQTSVTCQDVVHWLVRATLDSSSDRAAFVGLCFKNFPHVDGDRAAAFFSALERLAPELGGHKGATETQATQVLEDMMGEAPEIWRAAMRVHNMLRTIRSAEAQAQAEPTIPTVQRRSRLV